MSYAPWSREEGNGLRPETPFEKQWRAGINEEMTNYRLMKEEWEQHLEDLHHPKPAKADVGREIPFAGIVFWIILGGMVAGWVLMVLR